MKVEVTKRGPETESFLLIVDCVLLRSQKFLGSHRKWSCQSRFLHYFPAVLCSACECICLRLISLTKIPGVVVGSTLVKFTLIFIICSSLEIWRSEWGWAWEHSGTACKYLSLQLSLKHASRELFRVWNAFQLCNNAFEYKTEPSSSSFAPL
jgi:hypothetical protein